jgi:hypothetical protein
VGQTFVENAMAGPFPPLANVSIAELADALNIPPHDALDAVIAAGVRVFWHEGHKYRSVDDLKQFLAEFNLIAPVRDIEVDLDATQAERFARNWDVELTLDSTGNDETANASKPLRKFVASDVELPGASTLHRIRLRG